MARRAFFAALVVLAFGCQQSADSPHALSRDPISVRGWIHDVAGAKMAQTAEMEIARRTEIFTQTSVWVEGSQYASGGVAENGAFIILDVPPIQSTVGFQAPGADNARLVLQDVPGNCDVFIPDVVLKAGGATVLDPTKIQVRLPASVDKRHATGKYATIAGVKVPIVETPLNEMVDRRDYPSPGGFRPVAVVK
ncbi:MAG TPA: hypothetical protein VFN10_12235 [Thermoanaerobaculia bacterium]|nr:hypothetical protein [Thermoanaerobaculia bacterium]